MGDDYTNFFTGGLGGTGYAPEEQTFTIDPASQSGTNFGSGALQALMTLGTGYLAKRMDVDIQQRVTGAQPLPNLRTTQNGIGGYGQVVRTPQGGTVAAVNLSAVMPLIFVAMAAFFLARRGG
jgi:hypothetical protein